VGVRRPEEAGQAAPGLNRTHAGRCSSRPGHGRPFTAHPAAPPIFGTVFRAFGAVWTTVTAIGLGLLLAGAAALVVASWSEVVTLIGTLGPWLLLNIAAVLALLAAAGSYVVNRLATV